MNQASKVTETQQTRALRKRPTSHEHRLSKAHAGRNPTPGAHMRQESRLPSCNSCTQSIGHLAYPFRRCPCPGNELLKNYCVGERCLFHATLDDASAHPQEFHTGGLSLVLRQTVPLRKSCRMSARRHIKSSSSVALRHIVIHFAPTLLRSYERRSLARQALSQVFKRPV